MQNLTPNEAEKLNKIYNLAYSLYNELESLRPGGGFKELISKDYCKYCGRIHKK